MEIPSFYLSFMAEAAALILLVLLGFIILLKRDKRNLTGYVFHLKTKVKQLTKKLKELDVDGNPAFLLIEDTLDYIKEAYEEKYGHVLGSPGENIADDNSKEHFLYIFGYQGLKATLTSLENSNTAESTWEKISAQMSALIENFRIMPETQFQTLIEEQVEEQVLQHSNDSKKDNKESLPPHANKAIDNASNKKNGSVTLVKDSGGDQFIQERKGEIERLKGQISSQFEEIWQLQNNISDKVSNSSDPEFKGISDDMETVTRQLKDAQMCITMMEADIATSDEEIIYLKEQLEQANIKASTIPPSNSELTEDIKKKDAIITRYTQESKEMLTLMDGMEANSDEQYKRIQELEKQLEK